MCEPTHFLRNYVLSYNIHYRLLQELVDMLAKHKITLLALDCIPRISRAQAFDVLSSMANIAGYKAVIEAASNYNYFLAGWSICKSDTKNSTV